MSDPADRAPETALGPILLSEARPGESVVVDSVDTSQPGGRRLLDLGFLPKTVVRVVRNAPLGDPISYYLRGSQLCLRRSEASRVRVSRLEVRRVGSSDDTTRP